MMALTQRVQLIDIYPNAHMYITSTFHDGYVTNEFTVACHGFPTGLAVGSELWTPYRVAEYIRSHTTVHPLHKIHILACNSADYDIASTASKISSVMRNTEVKGYVGSVYINFRHEQVYQYYLDNERSFASVERVLEQEGNSRVRTNNDIPNYYCVVFENGIMKKMTYIPDSYCTVSENGVTKSMTILR
ncbi:hypothetical protein ID850_12575 [Xenorhabdus sp. Flor]|uniref:hypothetical protein n=1 Tax=Xenorhabdus cabanillasii TaxID=351673 RepID=UPI0019C2DB4B|nr:hypothetical protein [Xenorhabdus sp. Flor]MBD2815587.1 hypothetical protein [Xenorhabdus sp. Flor]